MQQSPSNMLSTDNGEWVMNDPAINLLRELERNSEFPPTYSPYNKPVLERLHNMLRAFAWDLQQQESPINHQDQ